MSTATKRSPKLPRRAWTDAEREVLRRLYPTRTARTIGRLLQRTERAIYIEARELGLTVDRRVVIDGGFLAELRRLNGLGYDDTEASGVLGCERHTVARHRRLLGLPSNTRGERNRARVRAKTAEQCREAGVENLGQVRTRAFRQFAESCGWPADLRPRAVHILNALAERGPMTRREIADAIGMPWRGSRKSLKSNDPEGSYLANLIARGLVVSLGRVVRSRGRGRNSHLYSLSITTERIGSDGLD